MAYRRFFVCGLPGSDPGGDSMAVLYRDKYGYHVDHAERVEEDGDEWDVRGWDVPDDVQAYHDWADWPAIFETCDTPAEWRPGSDPEARACLTLDLASFYGPDNLDSYPVRMTLGALKRHRPFWRNVSR